MIAALAALAIGANSCSSDGGGTEPLPVVYAGEDRTAGSCQEVRIHGQITGAFTRSTWTVDGPLRPFLQDAGETVTLRAPSVTVPTDLTLRLTAETDDGTVIVDTTRVRVEPAATEPGFAEGMARDCAPFHEGVASGDPRPDSVVVWTRLSPDAAARSGEVRLEVASDPAFHDVVHQAVIVARAENDHTVKYDVPGLAPATTYFYRFVSADEQSSTVGRSRTAPRGDAQSLRFAVASCSSIYSGFFNAYRRIGERSDLDLMIHLGDYIYDFVDENEVVRVPEPFPAEPTNLAEWRARHAYYLGDPDLRLARANHPWAMIWDNHDVEARAPGYNGSVQAFREWNPMRDTDPDHPEIAFRRLEYGSLVDLILVDALLFRNIDEVPGTGAASILGNTQFEWLADQLRSSRAAWRVLGNQRIVGTVRINPIFAQAISGESRDVFDTGAWDGFPEDRSRLLSFLVANGIRDNLVLSGDSHISLALDLVDRPLEPSAPSAGVELLPTSISRGNFDETIFGLGFGFDQAYQLINNILTDTARRNPHHRFAELTLHGYGMLEIDAEKIVASIRYSPILDRSDEDVLGESLVVRRGANRWER